VGIFNKILSLILVVAIFVVTSGFSLHQHFCGEKMVSSHTSFIKHGKHHTCGHENQKKFVETTNKKNLDLTIVEEGCCKDVVASFQLDDTFWKPISKSFDFSIEFFPKAKEFFTAKNNLDSNNETFHFSNFPPWKNIDPFSLYQTYLI